VYCEHGRKIRTAVRDVGFPKRTHGSTATDRRGRLVANPGANPTASLLALAPLAAEGLIEDVVIDAKVRVSGSGRGARGGMDAVRTP